MLLKIKSCKDGTFDGEEPGEKITYFWVKGEDEKGLTIRFGTQKDYTEFVGKEVEVLLEKTIFGNGKTGHKEVRAE